LSVGRPVAESSGAPLVRPRLTADLLGHARQLRLAMMSGQAGTAQRLLALGIHADQLIDGEPLLLAAACGGNVENCRLLLDGGAKVDRVGKFYPYAAIHIAVSKRSMTLTKLLIECGCDVDAPDRDGKTALHHAAQKSSALCDILLAAGADVAIHMSKRPESSALHLAAEAGAVEVCANLCARGVDVDWRDTSGEAALHAAASSASVEACRVIVDAGGDPGAIAQPKGKVRAGRELYTPFQQAVRLGHVGVVRYFVEECGQDPAQSTSAGRTMLQLAGGHGEMKMLLRSLKLEFALGSAIGRAAQDSVGANVIRRPTGAAL
jgi:ankyrin repeat protein